MSTNRNPLPPSLVANLQQVLISRSNGGEKSKPEPKEEESAAPAVDSEESEKKPVVLITNADGIESPGLVSLVQGLGSDGRCEVNVCAPQLLVPDLFLFFSFSAGFCCLMLVDVSVLVLLMFDCYDLQ